MVPSVKVETNQTGDLSEGTNAPLMANSSITADAPKGKAKATTVSNQTVKLAQTHPPGCNDPHCSVDIAHRAIFPLTATEENIANYSGIKEDSRILSGNVKVIGSTGQPKIDNSKLNAREATSSALQDLALNQTGGPRGETNHPAITERSFSPRRLTVKSEAVKGAKRGKPTKVASMTETTLISNKQTTNSEPNQAEDLAEEEDASMTESTLISNKQTANTEPNQVEDLAEEEDDPSEEEEITSVISEVQDSLNVTKRPIFNASDASNRPENNTDYTYLSVEEGGSETNESNMRSLSLSSISAEGKANNL